jgi:hypothetical protein
VSLLSHYGSKNSAKTGKFIGNISKKLYTETHIIYRNQDEIYTIETPIYLGSIYTPIIQNIPLATLKKTQPGEVNFSFSIFATPLY